AALISDLIVTEERKEHFIWPKIPYFSTPYVFISKAEFPSLELYRIGQKTVAIVDWCATHQLYKQWFPNNSNIKLYNSQDEALDALEKGEADLFFNLGYILYYQKNYREKPNYKANYTFPVLNDIFFGLNKNEKILSSIIDKSILYIDIDKISYDWMSRSYDYSKVLAQTRVTYLTVFAAVLLVVLLVIAILMVIIINKGKLIAKQSQRLEQTLVRANAANKAKSELLTTISHEIRTPMNAILGITEIQLQNETLSQNTKESLGIIYNSGDSLLRIINDLLDLSKIEAKKLEIIPIEYDIASLISDTTLLNMMRIESKPIEFKLNVDENIPAILFGDELRIKQVLNNVLSNAFKYTDSGEVSMSVSAEENFEVTLVFRISDTGYGMTKEQIRKIFDEYSRFNLIDSNKIEGTGLGMNITQGLVSLMEGSISVESEPGKGSVFTIRLPQKKVGTDVLGKELVENLQKFSVSNISEIEKIKIVREPMPYGKVLVVDDVESNLYVAKNLLESYDLSVDLATNGFEAIEKIESGKVYDIVLMDHMMPKMDGIETTKKIREQGYKHPIIALTANAIVGQAEMFLENGFDGFISKPIDTALLNSELNRFIRDKKSPKVLSKSHKSDTVLFSTFVRDAKKVLPFFELTLKNIDSISDDDLHLFSIKAHGIKSALSNIYKTEVSKLAAILEMAGKKHDKNAIKAQTQGLIDALHSIVSEIEAREKETVADRDENTDYLHEQLRIISKACENYNIKAANAALDNLKEMSWTHETKAFLEKIEEHLLQSDFEEVEAEIRCSYAHLLQKGKQTTQ
ncbi:MAG: response regulator, partial [Fibromonadaceae bacterium]|nr:response regulator [Fibromonadaceae bacterium]